MLVDLVNKVGSEKSKGKLTNFELTADDQKRMFNDLLSFVDENKDAEILITQDIIFDMMLGKHDLREGNIGKNSKNSEEAQSELDLLKKLSESSDSDLSKFINNEIDESIKNRDDGKPRKKHVVVDKEEYIKE